MIQIGTFFAGEGGMNAWTIFVVLMIPWLLGLVSGYTIGGFIHALLVIAIVVVLIRIIQGGISYTTREKVVDIGPIQMTAEKTKMLPLPPLVGAVALVGDIVLLLVGSRKG